MTNIPFLKPNLVRLESYQEYLIDIEKSRLYSNYGPLNTKFEERVARDNFDGIGAVTTVQNATLGLMLAIKAIHRPQGKYAVMPSFTFAATPLAAMWCGLIPYFVDVDPFTWCSHQEQLESVLNELGDDVAVVVPYSTFGTNLELSWYSALHESGIPVVLDAAASFGSSVNGDQQGKGFPGIVVYSFHATKSFAVGEGGLLYSASLETIVNIRQAANFGFGAARASEMQGFNAKVSEFTAAVALATLDVFPEKILTRQRIYHEYIEHMNHRGLFERGWQVQENKGTVAHQFFPILCPSERINLEFVKQLENAGIQARTYFAPACHQQPQFSSCPHTSLVITEDLTRRSLSLPLWDEIQVADVHRVVEALM